MRFPISANRARLDGDLAPNFGQIVGKSCLFALRSLGRDYQPSAIGRQYLRFENYGELQPIDTLITITPYDGDRIVTPISISPNCYRMDLLDIKYPLDLEIEILPSPPALLYPAPLKVEIVNPSDSANVVAAINNQTAQTTAALAAQTAANEASNYIMTTTNVILPVPPWATSGSDSYNQHKIWHGEPAAEKLRMQNIGNQPVRFYVGNIPDPFTWPNVPGVELLPPNGQSPGGFVEFDAQESRLPICMAVAPNKPPGTVLVQWGK
jgi:hypothetical protein